MDIIKTLLFSTTLVVFSVFSVGGVIHIPKIELIEFDEMVINVGSREDQCEKYHKLFMELLHESLECSEDYAGTPKQSDHCLKLSRLLSNYSILRSKYCYGDEPL